MQTAIMKKRGGPIEESSVLSKGAECPDEAFSIMTRPETLKSPAVVWLALTLAGRACAARPFRVELMAAEFRAVTQFQGFVMMTCLLGADKPSRRLGTRGERPPHGRSPSRPKSPSEISPLWRSSFLLIARNALSDVWVCFGNLTGLPSCMTRARIGLVIYVTGECTSDAILANTV
jgi:hypothetical protein